MTRPTPLALVPLLVLTALLSGSAGLAQTSGQPSGPAGAPAVPGPPPDPAALQSEIAAVQLAPAGAVTLKNLKLNAGLGLLHLADGVLVPASPVGGKTIEMVFVGKGRISLDPPDEVEAGQLELFTGGRRLDEEFQDAVLVVGLDAAVDAMMRRPKVGELAPDVARRAAELYTRWRTGPVRKLLDVDGAVLSDALADPRSQGYFVAWFQGQGPGQGEEQKDFLYVVEPGSEEQVTLGRFEPLDATEKEKRKLRRFLHREQEHGHLIGVELEDMGQWDTWLSAALRGKDGKPVPGISAYEPTRYKLEVTLGDKAQRLDGTARIELEPVLAVPPRLVSLALHPDLAVRRVTDAAGTALFAHRSGSELTVVLPRPPAAGEKIGLTIEYQGKLISKEGRTFQLLDTLNWYPHAGTVDRAPYDVTFRWPKGLDLLASGHRMEGGESPDGTRWERRTLDRPTDGFTFEVGKFRTETLTAGHVKVTLAFDAEGRSLHEKEVREEIARTVTDALGYFEEQFGPYPLDEMTVVTVPRDYSQALLGFVTLSNFMMADFGVWNQFLGFEDRRTVIAHELAHQWWGHQVGWKSYRDQWISEAMANYAALRYARTRLKGEEKPQFGPTSGWQDALTTTTEDGRVIESLGPVVLGQRLYSSRASDAYEPIVYRKGAVILDMLARSMGEDNFVKVLQQVVKAAANRPISTEDFLDLVERSTGSDFDWFANQYVYGTGLPDVYYTYRLEKAGEGKWAVRGQARQQAPYRFRYRVVKTSAGAFDVARERLDQIAVQTSALVVPFEVEVYDPSRPPAEGKKKGKNGEVPPNAVARGHVLLKGESTDLAIDLPLEPRNFWLDKDEAVFGRFFNESRSPKRVLFYKGLDAAAGGQAAEAAALYDQALAAEVAPEDEPKSALDKDALRTERKALDGFIELGRARLLLDQNRDAEAREAFTKANKAVGSYGGWVREELRVLESRLDLRQGTADKAYKRLRKGLYKSGDIDGTEGYVLLAIAAQATGNKADLERAVKAAKENGADLALLGQ
jgi:hypothetical protein